MASKRSTGPHPARQPLMLIAAAIVMTIGMAIAAGMVLSPGPEAGAGSELDQVWPVETPEETGGEPAIEVAIGDSTMALSEGEVADRKHGCRHERTSWPELIGAVNLSCSGAGARTATGLAREAAELSEDTSRVYITVGTNSLRYGMSSDQTRKAVTTLAEVISKRAPRAEIVFVGYLTVWADPECMSDRDQRIARQVDWLHAEADEIMADVAKELGAEWVPVDGAEYPACDPEKTYIHGSGPDRGTPWHTTATGHHYVADKVTTKVNP